jgi:hypothetical protein
METPSGAARRLDEDGAKADDEYSCTNKYLLPTFRITDFLRIALFLLLLEFTVSPIYKKRHETSHLHITFAAWEYSLYHVSLGWKSIAPAASRSVQA